MENNVDSVHFQHFSPFFFIIFMANYPLEKYCYVHFLRGESEKMYISYTNLNVDNYGSP